MKRRAEIFDIPDEKSLNSVISDCRRSIGFISVETIKQDNGKFTLIAIFETEPIHRLGKLSEKFESKGDPGAIGNDSTGGFSYGTYQIASKTGSINAFLEFLQTHAPDFYNSLIAAGGSQGAKDGTIEFKSTWKKLAEDEKFDQMQYQFIKQKFYDVQVSLLDKIGLDVEQRSEALKNVVWSTAVQHGAHTNLIKEALSGKEAATLSDKQIINAIYDERSKVDEHFRNSTDNVKESVKIRFAQERHDALVMLA